MAVTIIISAFVFIVSNLVIVKLYKLNRVLMFDVSGEGICIEDLIAKTPKKYCLPKSDVLLTKELAIKFITGIISDYSKFTPIGKTFREKWFDALFRPALVVTIKESSLRQAYQLAEFENLAHAIKRVSGINSSYQQDALP